MPTQIETSVCSSALSMVGLQLPRWWWLMTLCGKTARSAPAMTSAAASARGRQAHGRGSSAATAMAASSAKP